MIRLVGLLVAITLFDGSVISYKEGLESVSLPADSIKVVFHPVLDSLGVLEGYKSQVFTPICEEDKCYAVEINFWWDPIGRFHHYDTLPGQPLTKLDHDPFLEEDYQKLSDILTNPNSVLAKYKKEELVQDTRTSEVDGITGATIQEVKENVIEGAVYSCYTLWHLAHGSVVDSIKQTTLKRLNPSFVKKLVSSEDQEINYFLINHFSEEDFARYLPEILETIGDGKGYYPKNAIEKMPVDVVRDSVTQSFFSKNFNQLNYFSQIALLKKLSGDTLTEELAAVIKHELTDRKSIKNDLIKALLGLEL